MLFYYLAILFRGARKESIATRMSVEICSAMDIGRDDNKGKVNRRSEIVGPRGEKKPDSARPPVGDLSFGAHSWADNLSGVLERSGHNGRYDPQSRLGDWRHDECTTRNLFHDTREVDGQRCTDVSLPRAISDALCNDYVRLAFSRDASSNAGLINTSIPEFGSFYSIGTLKYLFSSFILEKHHLNAF